MNNSMLQRFRGRKGVALIVVLGLISVFMLSAVSFSISMRQERQGAARLRDGVQARHILWAALSTAIDDINKDLDTGGANCLIIPDWYVLRGQTNETTASFLPTNTTLSSTEVKMLVPGFAHKLIDDNANPNYWVGVTNTTGIKGRYSYTIINATDCLDISMAGATNRLRGRDCSEIDPDPAVLPDIFNKADFKSDRNTDVRYETLAELRSLNTGIVNNPSNIVAWSMAPINERMDADYYPVSKVNIGGDEAVLIANQDKIKKAFIDSGLSINSAGIAYTNLLDYVDADSIPRFEPGLGPAGSYPKGPNGEAVPMIYGASMAAVIIVETADPVVSPHSNLVTVIYRPNIKLWYPFLNASSDQFKMDYSWANNAGVGNAFAKLIPPKEELTCPVTADTSHTPISIPLTEMITNQLVDVDQVSFLLNVDIHVKARVKMDGGAYPDAVVDTVPADYDGAPIANQLSFALTNMINNVVMNPPVVVECTNWIECLDPRFNWDTSVAARQWYKKDINGIPDPKYNRITAVSGKYYEPTLENCSTVGILRNDDEAIRIPYYTHTDGDSYCYVKNRPIESPGELGNLVIKPWSTIKLYDHNCFPGEEMRKHGDDNVYQKVFDYFYVAQSNASVYKRGVINVNTRNRDVMAAAFVGCPNAEWTNNYQIIDAPTARNIALALTNAWPHKTIAELAATNMVDWTANLFGGANLEIYREGALRNTLDMFTTRCNYFYVILKADSYTEMMGKKGQGISVLSTYAVAEVWRDPFRAYNSDGTKALDSEGFPIHKTFIRSFKILDD